MYYTKLLRLSIYQNDSKSRDNNKLFLKKTINIFLIIIFLTTTTGIVVNKHIMRGELYSVSLFIENDGCCPGMNMMTGCMDCCEDEIIVIKNEDTIFNSTIPSLEIKLKEINKGFNLDFLIKFSGYLINNKISAKIYKSNYWTYRPPPKLLEKLSNNSYLASLQTFRC